MTTDGGAANVGAAGGAVGRKSLLGAIGGWPGVVGKLGAEGDRGGSIRSIAGCEVSPSPLSVDGTDGNTESSPASRPVGLVPQKEAGAAPGPAPG